MNTSPGYTASLAARQVSAGLSWRAVVEGLPSCAANFPAACDAASGFDHVLRKDPQRVGRYP